MLNKPPARVTRQQQQQPPESLEVVSTDVEQTTDAQGNTVVTTTLAVRDANNKLVTQRKTEKRAAPRAATATLRFAGSADATSKGPTEFVHCMGELLATERDFANRMEVIVLFYEKPVRDAGLLTPEAMHGELRVSCCVLTLMRAYA